MATLEEIRLVVRTELEDAIRDLNRLRDDVEDTGRAAQTAGDRGASGLAQFAKGAMDIKAAFGIIKDSIQTVKQVWDFAREGAELATLEGQFDNLAASIGANADDMVEAMRRASGGMLSDSELIKSASDLISLGLTDTQDDTVELATLISQLGWDMQTVIMTFANNSKMRLDALGLSVTDVEERMVGLEAQGYSTDQAFDMAVIEAGKAKLELLGSATETTSAAFDRLEVKVTNFVDKLKTGLAEGLEPWVNFLLGDFTNAIHQAIEGQADIATSATEFAQTQHLGRIAADDLNQMLLQTATSFEDYQRGFELAGEQNNALAYRTKQFTEAQVEAQLSIEQASQEIDGWSSGLQRAEQDQTVVIDSLEEMATAEDEVATAANEATAAIEHIPEEIIIDVEKAINDMNRYYEVVHRVKKELDAIDNMTVSPTLNAPSGTLPDLYP